MANLMVKFGALDVIDAHTIGNSEYRTVETSDWRCQFGFTVLVLQFPFNVRVR